MANLARQRDSIRDDLKSQKARQNDGLFEASLREALTKKGVIKMHKDVIQRLVASYVGSGL